MKKVAVLAGPAIALEFCHFIRNVLYCHGSSSAVKPSWKCRTSPPFSIAMRTVPFNESVYTPAYFSSGSEGGALAIFWASIVLSRSAACFSWAFMRLNAMAFQSRGGRPNATSKM